MPHMRICHTDFSFGNAVALGFASLAPTYAQPLRGLFLFLRFEALVQGDELLRQLVPGVEVDHRNRVFVRFLDFHRGRQIRLQHQQAFVDQFLHNLLRQVGAGLVLVDYDALHLQAVVVIGADFFGVGEQRIERIARKLVAIEGNQAGIRAERVKKLSAGGVSMKTWSNSPAISSSEMPS